MNVFKPGLVLVGAFLAALAGCSAPPAKTPDVSGSIRTSLDQAGFKDVSATQDQEKGVVTLSGHVAADGDKAQAETIAQSLAGNQVVSNQIEVIPPEGQNKTREVNADLDAGIAKNLDAALIEDRLHDSVKYAVKNHVVTLTGEVNSQEKRAQAEQVASAVLNVQQVVNELQVSRQKASSTN